MNKAKKQELIDALDNIHLLIDVLEHSNHLSSADLRTLQAMQTEIFYIFDELQLR